MSVSASVVSRLRDGMLIACPKAWYRDAHLPWGERYSSFIPGVACAAERGASGTVPSPPADFRKTGRK